MARSCGRLGSKDVFHSPLRARIIPYVGGVLELGVHQRGWGAGGVGYPLRRVPSICRWIVGVWDTEGILITERERKKGERRYWDDKGMKKPVESAF